MPRLIQDEFTCLPISAQRRYQLRASRDGKCRICGQPVVPGKEYCPEHHKNQLAYGTAARSKPKAVVVLPDII